MALLAVDEVMLREPRLLVPQLQPMNLVKINRTHPLSKGCIEANVIGRTGNIATSQGLATQTAAFPHRPELAVTGTVSIVVHCIGGATNENFPSVINKGSSNYMPYRVYFDDWTNDIRFTRVNSSWATRIYQIATVPVRTPMTFVISQNGNMEVIPQFALNGKISDMGLIGGVGTGAASDNGGDLTVGTTSRSNTGTLFFAIFNRALSVEEMVSLSKDPYQFMVPA